MNPAQQKAAAKAFVARWQAAEGNEDREARSFWIEFAQELLGMQNATYALDFERRVKGRKIDVFYEDMGVLVENKSRGCSLDERYTRSKKVGAETPYEQAKWYADNLPHSIRPRWIIVCNFDEIRIHDLEKEHPGHSYTSVSLSELPDQIHLFGFFTDKSKSRIEKEKQLSVKAGELVGRLYDRLSKQYQNIDTDEREQRSLNVLCVRLVFLLYAEDAGLLSFKNQFYDYLRNIPANRMRAALMELFDVLDTPEDERKYLDDELAAFPYINGGLFTHEDIVIPNLTDQIKVDLLAEASAGFNWKDISPTIFGAAFESTLNPETRRSGGMHYTSVENIHKVIDPLFLDGLKAELARIEGIKTERDRIRELRIFQRKLATLTFLDPAAGSHNFLTETYISLRKLELRVIENLHGDQTSFDLVDNPIMVNIGQFYAIEINDFAVSVGKTALWIAEQQMMEKTQELLPYQRFDFLPLKSITNSVCANALRMDWNDVIPAEKCSYIIGNPPFVGSSMCSKEQKKEIVDLYGKDVKRSSSIDYVSAWYYKAAEMMQANNQIKASLVSTNSITFGEQVYPIWNTLQERFGVEINFAWKSFVWNNEASNQAHVHVVIIGFSMPCDRKAKKLFDANGGTAVVGNINPYLIDAPNVVIESRASQISGAPRITLGCKPVDGGNYVFNHDEMTSFIKEEPKAERYFHKFLGSNELIKGKERYCLYIGSEDVKTLEEMPLVMERVQAVRELRLKSSAAPTRKAADRPTNFFFECIPSSNFIAIPEVSSERRPYIPAAFLGPETMVSNKLWVMENGGLYEFGVIMSQTHNAWMRVVTGRLKSDYQYSGAIVYNNFVWPDPTPEQKAHIEECAQLVLDARAEHPDKSLADLYDPDKMPERLCNAHKLLDLAVEDAYGVDFNGDEEKIVAHLFKLYAEMAEGKK